MSPTPEMLALHHAVTDFLEKLARRWNRPMKFSFIARDPSGDTEMEIFISDDEDFAALGAVLNRMASRGKVIDKGKPVMPPCAAVGCSTPRQKGRDYCMEHGPVRVQ